MKKEPSGIQAGRAPVKIAYGWGFILSFQVADQTGG